MLLLLLLARAGAAATSGIAMPATLTVMVEDDAAPWSFADGSGFANEVVLAAFKAAGVKAELEVVPYARCKNAVLQGRCAACFSMSPDPAFTGKVRFSAQPLFVCHAEVYAGAHRPLRAKRLQDLPRGAVLGTVLGYEYPPEMVALRESGRLAFEEGRSEELNLKKLGAGRLDGVLLNTNALKPGALMLAQAGVAGKVQRAFRAGVLKSYIGFSLGHAQGDWARRRFDQGYRRIAADGRLKAIEAKWQKTAP